MAEIKLKPCPFCGGEAEVIAHNKFQFYKVVCKHCKAQGYQFFPNEEQATEAWNRRADHD